MSDRMIPVSKATELVKEFGEVTANALIAMAHEVAPELAACGDPVRCEAMLLDAIARAVKGMTW